MVWIGRFDSQHSPCLNFTRVSQRDGEKYTFDGMLNGMVRPTFGRDTNPMRLSAMKQTADESVRRHSGISISWSGRARGFVDESFGPVRLLRTTLAGFSPTTPQALLLTFL